MKNARCYCLLGLLTVSVFGQPIAQDAWAIDDETKPVFQPLAIQAPDGFVIELAAAPPLVRYPMMACFDERGRLFVAESDGLNLQNATEAEITAQSMRFVRRLEDTDGDGRFDRSTIFADKLTMPEGALWHDGAFYILSAPYLWRLEDTDDDGVADKREKIIGAMTIEGRQNQNGPYLGPTGRLFFSGGTFGYDLVGKDGGRITRGPGWAGVFSCRADGSDVEIVGHAGINPVEVAFTAEGEMVATCNIIDRVDGRHDGLLHWVRGALYRGLPGQPHPNQTGVHLPPVSRWGQVAPSGLVRYRGTAFGDEYRDDLFACLFNAHTVMRVRMERDGSTFQSRDEEFLTAPGTDFRPTDVLEDADGSLLVIDTGGWVIGGSCPSATNAQPGVPGAIYRVRKVGAKSVSDPRGLSFDWAAARSEQIVAWLDDPRPAVRDRALATLAQRGQNSVSALAAVFASTTPTRSVSEGAAEHSTEQRLNAVWALSRIGTPDARAALRVALRDSDVTVRQAAATSVGDLHDSQATRALVQLLRDAPPPIRRAAATALGQIASTDAVPELLDSLSRDDNDDHLLHALIYALIEINHHEATAAGLSHASPRARRAAVIALDQMADGRLTRELATPLLATDHQPLRQTTVAILIRRGWAEQFPSMVRDWLANPQSTPEQTATALGAMAALAHDQHVRQVMIDTLTADGTPPATRSLVLEAFAESDLDELPQTVIDLLGELVSRGEPALQQQALAVILAHDTDRLDPQILQLSRDSARPSPLRLVAFAILGRHGRSLDRESFALLVSQLGDETLPLDRWTAAEALAGANLDAEQLAELAGRLAQIGPLEVPILLRAFERASAPLASESIGARLVESLDRSPGLTSLSPQRLHNLAERLPPRLADSAKALAVRLQPNREQQATRLAELESQMAGGDPARGQTVFFGSRAACAACHRSGSRGGDLGPDLSQVGRIRNAHDLLEAIVFPDATLVNGYETYTVATASGEIHSGLLSHQTADAVHLRASAAKGKIRIPRTAIADMAPSRTSLMPAGFDRAIPLDDLRDLVAYLQSLK